MKKFIGRPVKPATENNSQNLPTYNSENGKTKPNRKSEEENAKTNQREINLSQVHDPADIKPLSSRNDLDKHTPSVEPW